MRHLVTGTFLAVVLAAGVGAASAQYRDPYGNPVYRDGQRDGYRPDYRGAYDPVDRVLGELDRMGWGGYRSWSDRRNLEQARKDLVRFQENRARGRFDRGRLDNAIGHLDHMARSYDVDPRSHQFFVRAVTELREFRARSTGYRR